MEKKSEYIGDLVFNNGEYTKDGVTKVRWVKVGALFKSIKTNAVSIKLHAVPTSPGWSGYLRVFFKDGYKSNNTTQNSGPLPEPPADEFDEPINLDDIPF